MDLDMALVDRHSYSCAGRTFLLTFPRDQVTLDPEFKMKRTAERLAIRTAELYLSDMLWHQPAAAKPRSLSSYFGTIGGNDMRAPV